MEKIRTKRHGLSKEVSKNLFVLSILAFPLIMFAVFYIGINVNSILLAFRSYNIQGEWKWTGFENFRRFILNMFGKTENVYYRNGLITSLKMYSINLVICMPLYIFFSYILFKKFFGHKTMRAIIMIPQILSGFIVCLVFKKFVSMGVPSLMKSVFSLDSFPDMMTHPSYAFGTVIFFMIWSSFSTSLIVYPNAMKEIDDGILEAARIDGVNDMFRELWYIILPLIYPTISMFLITGFAAILSTAGPVPTFYYKDAPMETITMGYLYWTQVLDATTYNGFPQLAAGGLIMTLVVAPLTLLLKWFLEKFGPVAEY